MNDVHLGRIDLNLLRVFDALADEGSATRAGVRLGLSQSAISHALGRLREQFGDPLFVRSPDGMRATPRAAEIAPSLREALLQLQLAIAPSSFSPQDTDRRFNVAAGAYMGAVLLPQVIERIRDEAPRAAVRVRAVDNDLEETLRSGRVDVALGAFGDVSERFGREPLFQESGVWVLRQGNPAARDPFTLERLASVPHVALTPGPEAEEGATFGWGKLKPFFASGGGAVIEDLIRSAGLRREVAVRVYDVYSGLQVVARTNMAMLAPRRLAMLHGEALGLKIFDEPYASSDLHAEALWSREAGAHPAIDWLRNVLREESRKI